MNLSIFKAIFASMEQGVAFIDAQDRIAYCNPILEKIRDVKIDQVLGRSILDCHPKKSHLKVLQIIEDLKSGEVQGRHRMNIQMMGGKFYDNTYSSVWGPKNKYLGYRGCKK
jgi:PAS domain S-box-containing protein